MSTTQSINDEARRDLAAPRTTGRRAVWSPLLKKEAKQLAPLLLALLGCGVLLHLLALLQETSSQKSLHGAALFLVPLLFAIGAGPLLVSQEKEQRSLRWMASLPVRPRSIVISKLIVSVLGLIVCWCISLAVTLLFCPSIFAKLPSTGLELLFWPANTFFLLAMGFALAWIMPTAGSTLVALMLSAGVSSVFAGLANDVFGKNYDHAEFLGFLSVFQVVTIAILTVAAIRFGKRSFVAEANSASSFAWIRKREHSKLAVDRTKAPPLSPASSLIWQIGWQNRMLWVGVSFIALMGLVSVACGTGFLKYANINAFPPVVGCLVLSWLGASVFGSDANHGRIRFLADRGVSPFKIWWTRLVLPLICVIFGMLVFFLMYTVSNWSRVDIQVLALMSAGIGGVGITFSLLMAFGLAQWLPLWTRSSLIAFCVSPVLLFFSFFYVEFLLKLINAPWWLLIVSIGISFAATRLMLRPWMDGRMGLRYWMSQSALLAGALVVPLIPFLITFATYPDMPAALRRELNEEVKRYEPFRKEVELVIPVTSDGDENSETKDKFVGFGDSVSDWVIALERQLSSISGPIIYPRYARGVIKEAQLMSFRIDNSDPADLPQPYRSRYRRSMILLSKFSIAMRMSDRLIDQEGSDQIERWLVNELLQPGRKELFSDEEYSTMVAALADQTLRHQSRRRAVVIAWYGYLDRWVGQGQHDFGGLKLPAIPTASVATSWLVTDRNVGQATAALLEYLESKHLSSDEFPADIQSFWPAGAAEIERQFKGVDVNSIHTPGALWHQDWETKAAKLNESLK